MVFSSIFLAASLTVTAGGDAFMVQGFPKDFKLDKRAKECLFRQSWRGNWFKRDGLDVVQRAKRHRRMHAAKVAVQASIPEAVRTGLMKLLEDRKNGRN